jgi:hypothetical protein
MDVPAGAIALVAAGAAVQFIVPRILGWMGVSWMNRPSKRMDKVILRAVDKLGDDMETRFAALDGRLDEHQQEDDRTAARVTTLETRLEPIDRTHQEWFRHLTPAEDLDIKIPHMAHVWRRLGHIDGSLQMLAQTIGMNPEKFPLRSATIPTALRLPDDSPYRIPGEGN